MTDLFILLIINALICIGLYKSWQFEYSATKMIKGKFCHGIDNNTKGVFWFYKFYFLDRIPYRLSKPLGNCATCMASVFSVLPYWFTYDHSHPSSWLIYPFYILALAGLNSIFSKFVEV